jgi:hypothetical protein
VSEASAHAVAPASGLNVQLAQPYVLPHACRQAAASATAGEAIIFLLGRAQLFTAASGSVSKNDTVAGVVPVLVAASENTTAGMPLATWSPGAIVGRSRCT